MLRMIVSPPLLSPTGDTSWSNVAGDAGRFQTTRSGPDRAGQILAGVAHGPIKIGTPPAPSILMKSRPREASRAEVLILTGRPSAGWSPDFNRAVAIA